MKIKRTFATTMREALALVKQEQGPDAVILGNKKVPGGVELISAIDYDETTVAQYVSESLPTPPKSDQSGRRGNDVSADAWVGSVINDSLDGRKEPVLGPVAGVRASVHAGHGARACQGNAVPNPFRSALVLRWKARRQFRR